MTTMACSRLSRTVVLLALAVGCGDDGTQADSGDSGDTGVGSSSFTGGSEGSSGTTETGGVVDESTGSSGGVDSTGASSEGSTSGPPNELPLAEDDLYYVPQSALPLVVAAPGVLANDMDPEGEALVVSDFDAASSAGATVAVAADGSFDYAIATFFGEDAFGYTAEDPLGGTDMADVDVVVVPQAIELGWVAAGTGGLAIDGEAANDYAGAVLAFGGDFDGDGLDDVLVGARGAGPAGRAYVVLGGATAQVELADLDVTSAGFAIEGQATGDEAGFSVAFGDVYADGRDDAIVGARFADPLGNDEGRTYVVLGTDTIANVSLADVAMGVGGFTIDGAEGDEHSGFAVASGDIDGDGFDDVVIGAPDADLGGALGRGAAYIVRGSASPTTVALDDIANGMGGFVITGEVGDDNAGNAVAVAPDTNGDGLDDIVVGAPLSNIAGGNSGRAYVVFGKTDTTTVALGSVASGVGGFALDGEAAIDQAGWSVAGLGDLDGDGLGEIAVGAPGAEDDIDLQGRAYVVWGSSTPTSASLATIATGTGGYVIDGEAQSDLLGWTVAGAGDHVGSGRGGLLVGAQGADFSEFNAGRTYYFGGTMANPVAYTADGEGNTDVSSWALAGGGDFDGDGFGDVVIGAYQADVPELAGGRAYVVRGGDWMMLGRTLGTAGPDMILATAMPDRIFTGQGDDQIEAPFAAGDLFSLGAGDDSIAIGNTDFLHVDGGRGDDTLRLDTMDLALDLQAYYLPPVVGIETVDLTGTGDNALFLDASDIRQVTDANVLTVLGDDGDQVVADLPGFTDFGSMNGFHVWGFGAVTLVVADAVEAFVTT
jgi:hypothetical protein